MTATADAHGGTLHPGPPAGTVRPVHACWPGPAGSRGAHRGRRLGQRRVHRLRLDGRVCVDARIVADSRTDADRIEHGLNAMGRAAARRGRRAGRPRRTTLCCCRRATPAMPIQPYPTSGRSTSGSAEPKQLGQADRLHRLTRGRRVRVVRLLRGAHRPPTSPATTPTSTWSTNSTHSPPTARHGVMPPPLVVRARRGRSGPSAGTRCRTQADDDHDHPVVPGEPSDARRPATPPSASGRRTPRRARATFTR